MDKPAPVSPATMAARSRLSAALMEQARLATASIANPALEKDYVTAVAAVAMAAAQLEDISR